MLLKGSDGDVAVWIVEDGKRLFIDKNANGDLTDDGPPIAPSNVRSVGAKGWDLDYILPAIMPLNGSRHTSFQLRRWNYDQSEDSYGLSLSVDGRLPMYAGWFGTFWSGKPETAPVIHFGGPFTPRLLRYKEFALGPERRQLSLALVNLGSEPGAQSRLSIEALPADWVPELHIEWPTPVGAAPLRTSHKLTERCCYWEFYTTTFQVPTGAVIGKAKVTVDLPPSTTPIELTSTEFIVPVVAETEADAIR